MQIERAKIALADEQVGPIVLCEYSEYPLSEYSEYPTCYTTKKLAETDEQVGSRRRCSHRTAPGRKRAAPRRGANTSCCASALLRRAVQMRAESEQLSQQIKHLNDQIRELVCTTLAFRSNGRLWSPTLPHL